MYFFDYFICVNQIDSPIKVEGVKRQQEQLWPSKAQWVLDNIASIISLDLEPSKHKSTRPSNVLLRAEGDMSNFKSDKTISFRTTVRRRTEIIGVLKICQQIGKMKPCETPTILGRLNILLSTSYTSVRRVGTQPLVD